MLPPCRLYHVRPLALPLGNQPSLVSIISQPLQPIVAVGVTVKVIFFLMDNIPLCYDQVKPSPKRVKWCTVLVSYSCASGIQTPCLLSRKKYRKTRAQAISASNQCKQSKRCTSRIDDLYDLFSLHDLDLSGHRDS